MGRNPEEYCDYWTSRFPKLLMHSWYSMHCVKNEHIFSRYYDKQYDFIQVISFVLNIEKKSPQVNRDFLVI
jgi:serine/threonine-protein kinase/endoribonuclease IRE1